MGAIVAAAERTEALRRGALVVTSNERAARTLRLAWDREQRASGEKTWEPAKALSWREWTQALWRRLLLEGKREDLLLSTLQERKVWEQVLRTHPEVQNLRGPAALAAMATHAWRKLCAYSGQESFGRMATSLQGDAGSFAHWANSFRERCAADGLLSEAELERELARSVRDGDLRPGEREIVLLGFDRLTPVQGGLLDAWRETGVLVTIADQAAKAIPTAAFAESERDELRGCARWVRSHLNANPETRIAVIVTALDRERDAIESALREIVAPEMEGIAANGAEAPYEFSLGRALDYEPMIQVALDLLHWAVEPLALERVSRLLLSPYVAAKEASAEEQASRAELDAGGLRQRLRLRPEMTIKAMHAAVRETRRMPGLTAVLARMAAASEHFDLQAREYGEWAEWMRGWLALAQWSECRSGLTSLEYQVQERWQSALDSMATLDFSGEAVELIDALLMIKQIARETVFAPESRNAAVQVLGPIEAAGSTFDAMWVLRCGESSWPPGTAAQTLLPWTLQRELGMPGTDAGVDREQAQRMTVRLAGGATEVVFSYAQMTPDGTHQRAAACVRAIGAEEQPLAEIAPAEMVRATAELEHLEDAGEIRPLPDRVHRGGARLLELQAACGFRAFAELRMGGGEIREREAGLSAGERGSAVHLALEWFWEQVGAQSALRAMSEGDRRGLLERAVDHGLREAAAERTAPWDTAYVEVQRERLMRLLTDWLAMEMERPEFTVMTQEEKRRDVTVGPLRLALRMDRVDLVNGQQVVLDYKTGAAHTAEWLGERPDKPQVPLYALLASTSEGEQAPPLGAVGFGEVRAGKDMKLRGFEATRGMLTVPAPRSRPARMESDSFAEQVERWGEVIERLAEEFAAGDARVRPKQFPTTCERCGQRVLCRVDATMFEDLLDEEMAAADDDGRDG